METYEKYLEQMGSGNRKTGNVLTSFWVDGELANSSQQQIRFLKRLYTYALPFKREHIALTQTLLHQQDALHIHPAPPLLSSPVWVGT